MESSQQDRAALISDIEADAKVEAEGIIKDAEKQAADKRKYAAQQVESLLAEARKKAQEQADAIAKKALSAADLEIKRRAMSAHDAVMREIMTRVEKRLGAMVADRQAYRGILASWIAEAAVGLGAAEARVNATEAERAFIDAKLLAEASAAAEAQSGRKVTLTLSDELPLKSQGVILTADNGRTAFNNQVTTRLRRNGRQIRALIYDALFTDNRKDKE